MKKIIAGIMSAAMMSSFIVPSVYADEVNKYPYFKDMGIIVNESTFNYITLALSMLCHSKLIEYAMM